MMKQAALPAMFLLIGPAPMVQAASVEELAWLAGCWVSIGAEAGSGEQWMAPAGGTLLGVARTVKGSTTVAHEFLQIRESAGGGLEYIADPSGQNEAIFSLVRLSESEVIFENPNHDFPQRIIYRLAGETLLGRIEGQLEGKPRAADFPMKRVDCESTFSKPEKKHLP